MKRKALLKSILYFGCMLLIVNQPLFSFADKYLDEAEERKLLPVQSNQIENWPEGPSIGAGSAVLLDANSGVILYEKNIHEKMYPASTTKLMTCLLAMEKENVSLNDMVDFSHEAVFSVPPDGSNMGMDEGEAMTLEDCLYGILVLSANEVSCAVAEYVAGSEDKFVKLMNDRAKELGCEDTHFNNSHGYTDSNHYTSAYDLALIGREFFKNELLAKISRTRLYHWYPTDTQPDDIYLGSKNYFITGAYNCEGFVGSKTGYTDESRQVLVTCAERNDMRLICVIMQEEPPYQYEDTLALFNYGFNNFEKVNVSEVETRYSISTDGFFKTDEDIFGNSKPIMKMDTTSTVLLPKTAVFNDLTTTLDYNTSNPNEIAEILYDYNGKYVGRAKLLLAEENTASFVFDKETTEEVIDNDEAPTFIYVNTIIKWIAMAIGALIIILLIRRILSNFHFSSKR